MTFSAVLWDFWLRSKGTRSSGITMVSSDDDKMEYPAWSLLSATIRTIFTVKNSSPAQKSPTQTGYVNLPISSYQGLGRHDV